jgi:hypothetical protein
MKLFYLGNAEPAETRAHLITIRKLARAFVVGDYAFEVGRKRPT